MTEFGIKIALTLLLILIGAFFGRRVRARHMGELYHAERDLAHISTSSERYAVGQDSALLVGSAVLAQDKFGQFWGAVLGLFGKNRVMDEDLVDRARRFAIVRLKRHAKARGFCQIYGLRFETLAIGGGMACVQVLAYGTAVR